ncbi:PA2778 family cysteine peptidase [Alteromonas sp. PRIM-21]|uniref:PA2778 family cysteine peptidase n=1 Tax=Alteromonas sp. PRIM-21 TaxID=1454978 RepID=UPI0022B958F2|nr:PA2778 family cysteine peptidase [Alteromonas sp. PRIM-21]
MLAGLSLLFLLSGCQSTPQADKLRQEGLVSLPESHTIESVPFFPQEQFYCGPTTLSEVFGYYGKNTSPNDIAPKLFIPDKEGSLQLEMVSATRQFGFLPYTERGTLSSIISLVKEDIPVIVFQNLSIQLIPQWHYAVVIGFDSDRGTVTLHTGLTPNHEMSLELFERTWARGNYWYLAPVPPKVTSSEMRPFTYVSAAYDMLKVGDKAQSLAFLETASQTWPSYWLSYFLIANYYLEHPDIEGNNKLAITWFEKGYNVGQHQQAYVHNYIIALRKGNRLESANNVLKQALARFPDNDRLLALKE